MFTTCLIDHCLYWLNVERGDVESSSLGLKRFGGFENLNNSLAHRPAKEDLIEKNILKGELGED